MDTKYLKSHKVQIVILSILVVGLATLIYLVQTQQIFKPKAEADLHEAFSVTSNEPGREVTCSGSTCQTNTLNINIRLDDPNILIEP